MTALRNWQSQIGVDFEALLSAKGALNGLPCRVNGPNISEQTNP